MRVTLCSYKDLLHSNNGKELLSTLTNSLTSLAKIKYGKTFIRRMETSLFEENNVLLLREEDSLKI